MLQNLSSDYDARRVFFDSYSLSINYHKWKLKSSAENVFENKIHKKELTNPLLQGRRSRFLTN